MRAAPGMGAVTVAVAAIIGGAAFVHPADEVVETPPARYEPIVRSQLICPYAGGQANATSEIGLLSIPQIDVPGGESTVVATALTGAEGPAAPLLELTERGPIASATVKSGNPVGHDVRADGTLAAGLVGEQTTLASGADVRGLADVRCTRPTREAWFVGGSGQVGHRGRLVLSNPDTTPALVDLTLWDDNGRVKAPAADDISVPPRGERAVLLDALAPDSARLAVRAVAARGRVGMALELRQAKGLEPLGVSWAGGVPTPSTDVRIPAVPGQGERVLQILAPGNSDAIVKIDLHGPQGAFKPAGLEVVTVPAGTVAEVPLTEVASDQAVAVSLNSDVPVTAAVRVADRDNDGGDFAYATPVAPLDGPTASLHARAGDGLASTLLLTNISEQAASALVRVLTSDGMPARELQVEVAPGATQAVEISSPQGQERLAVVVYPEAPGALIASRVVTGSAQGGAMVDVVGLPNAPVTVRVPDVSWELSTGLSADPSESPQP